MNNEVVPPLDPHPLSDYVAWAGGRNREPILSVLNEKLPKTPEHVLEMASGSGMHINHFAPHFTHLHFHPSDKDTTVFDNIRQLTKNAGNKNVADPTQLDLTNPETWSNPGPEKSFGAIFCINIFQVAPISIADGMMNCAARLLKDDGVLLIYGPFRVDGQFSTNSNKMFHDTLASAGVPEWGLKDIADLKRSAANHGLELKEAVNMPSNNFTLVFGRVK